MKWRKVMAFSLAASMIAGQAVSAAPAAEAASESALQTQADSKSNTNASYTDPWTKTASVGVTCCNDVALSFQMYIIIPLSGCEEIGRASCRERV